MPPDEPDTASTRRELAPGITFAVHSAGDPVRAAAALVPLLQAASARGAGAPPHPGADDQQPAPTATRPRVHPNRTADPPR
jgi:hypothetical protein